MQRVDEDFASRARAGQPYTRLVHAGVAKLAAAPGCLLVPFTERHWDAMHRVQLVLEPVLELTQRLQGDTVQSCLARGVIDCVKTILTLESFTCKDGLNGDVKLLAVVRGDGVPSLLRRRAFAALTSLCRMLLVVWPGGFCRSSCIRTALRLSCFIQSTPAPDVPPVSVSVATVPLT